ncbi:MAG: hypothetical protein LM587_01020 [Candidatus Aenigmarchaeota archaeon]|nr:hypothetical protein [Candidatus Aenigmarchaeota archaeon]
MKKGILILFVFIASLFFSKISLSQQYTVGVSPPIIDLGDVNRGETKNVKFYIVSPSNEEMLVHLIQYPDNLDFVRAYNSSIIANYSEEDVSSWIKYFSNPVPLKPQTQPLQTPIGKITNWREISFLLSIPNNAEPGYHSFGIQPEPEFTGQAGGQVGVGIIAVTKVNVIFRVPGEAIRSGEIIDALGEGNKVRIFFKNTGTVTMKVIASGEIYYNNKTYSFSSARETVRPNELKEIVAFVSEPLEGNLDSKITVDYTSDKLEKKMVINFVKKPIQTQKPIDLTFLIYIILAIVIILVARWIYEKS